MQELNEKICKEYQSKGQRQKNTENKSVNANFMMYIMGRRIYDSRCTCEYSKEADAGRNGCVESKRRA